MSETWDQEPTKMAPKKRTNVQNLNFIAILPFVLNFNTVA